MTTDRLDHLETHTAEQQQMLGDLLSARHVRQNNEAKCFLLAQG